VISTVANIEYPDGSPYNERPYKVSGGLEEKEPVRRRQVHIFGSQQQLTKQNGVLVDTLFPSEHLVAMSIATVEQENLPITPEQLISLQDDLAPGAADGDYALAMNGQIIVLDHDTKEKIATSELY